MKNGRGCSRTSPATIDSDRRDRSNRRLAAGASAALPERLVAVTRRVYQREPRWRPAIASGPVDQSNVAVLVLRLVFGLVPRLPRLQQGVRRWAPRRDRPVVRSIGMRWPPWQARAAATTEIGAGLLFALGLITPFAAAGMIGVMVVASWVAHRKNGFFIFNEGWEFVLSIGAVAWAVATIGPGRVQPRPRRRHRVPRLDRLDDRRRARRRRGVRPAGRVLPAARQGIVRCRSWPTPATEQRPLRRRLGVWGWLFALICVGFAVFWVWALFFASKEAVNKIGDRAWAARAEGICDTAKNDMQALHDFRRIDHDSPQLAAMLAERADIVDRATDIVEQMLDEVVVVMPTDPKGLALVPQWEADYRTLIADRREYSRRAAPGSRRVVPRDRCRRHPDQRQAHPLRRRQLHAVVRGAAGPHELTAPSAAGIRSLTSAGA